MTVPGQGRIAHAQFMVQTQGGNGVTDLVQALYDYRGDKVALLEGFDGFCAATRRSKVLGIGLA